MNDKGVCRKVQPTPGLLNLNLTPSHTARSGSLSRLDSIRAVCGHLCRTDRTAVKGDFLDTVTAQVMAYVHIF